MTEAIGYTVNIDLWPEKKQKLLEEYGVKPKGDVHTDIHKHFSPKMDEIIAVLQYETFEDDLTDNIEYCSEGKFRLHIAHKTDDKEDLLTKKAIIKAIKEVLKISEWRIDIVSRENAVCKGCNEVITEEQEDRYGTYQDMDGNPVCYSCYEHDQTEPIGTVFFSDEPEMPYTFGYYHDYTEGQFKAEYHRTDGWRGHYHVVASEEWKHAHDDAILSMSEDAQELESFDEYLRQALEERGIRWARVITRTSNVFCCGYDFFIEADRYDEVTQIIAHLKTVCRDPERFMTTAITGKDPKDFDDMDRLLSRFAAALMKDGE